MRFILFAVIGVLWFAEASRAETRSVAQDTVLRIRGFGVYSESSGSADIGDDIPGITNDIDLEGTLGMDLSKFTGGGAVYAGVEVRL